VSVCHCFDVFHDIGFITDDRVRLRRGRISSDETTGGECENAGKSAHGEILRGERSGILRVGSYNAEHRARLRESADIGSSSAVMESPLQQQANGSAALFERALTVRMRAPESGERLQLMPLYLVFYFWLLLISTTVFVLERIFPSRKQEVLRAGFVQDLFWMVFNTQYVSWMLALVTVQLATWFNGAFLHIGVPAPQSLKLISDWPVWVQFGVFFVLKDFLEWNIHRWLHTVPWLWKIHQLHHSIEELDWAATFRSHWVELIIYKTIIYLPLVILGVDDRVVFAILVFSLLIQELSHANLKWDWGPLRYLINSPRFHAWHHAMEMHGKGGQNFGVNLAVWDWLFGTAYWPGHANAPAQYGFEGIQEYPRGIWGRLWAPFRRSRNERPAPRSE
jgi:sterol desaturase/sphingolipid hydroxylase (fatty acid hydroxylase superfamily)